MASPKIQIPAWLTSGRIRWYAIGGLAAGILAVVLVFVLLPDADAPRERRYRDVTACLLTDGRGISGGPAAVVWAGMQDASLTTLVKVQYLSVAGEQTATNAALYVNSLGQSGCVLVFAVGDAPVDALQDAAARFPDVRFIAVGRDVISSANLSSMEVSSDEALKTSVGQLVSSAKVGY